jgi:hypothetical protein
MAVPNLWDKTAEIRRLTDADIQKCAPDGFTLTPEMLSLVRAHIEAGADGTLANICKEANVPEGTARGWLIRINPLVQTIDAAGLRFIGRQCLLVWRAVLAKAARGDLAAAKMFLLRFDLEYRMASHKQQIAEMSHEDRSSLDKLTVAPAAPLAPLAPLAPAAPLAPVALADIAVTDAAVANANVFAFCPAAPSQEV